MRPNLISGNNLPHPPPCRRRPPEHDQVSYTALASNPPRHIREVNDFIHGSRLGGGRVLVHW